MFDVTGTCDLHRCALLVARVGYIIL